MIATNQSNRKVQRRNPKVLLFGRHDPRTLGGFENLEHLSDEQGTQAPYPRAFTSKAGIRYYHHGELRYVRFRELIQTGFQCDEDIALLEARGIELEIDRGAQTVTVRSRDESCVLRHTVNRTRQMYSRASRILFQRHTRNAWDVIEFDECHC